MNETQYHTFMCVHARFVMVYDYFHPDPNTHHFAVYFTTFPCNRIFVLSQRSFLDPNNNESLLSFVLFLPPFFCEVEVL
jgi:hypothetical protein